MLQHEITITAIKSFVDDFHHVTGERSRMRMDEPITDVFHYKSMILNPSCMYMWVLNLEEVVEPHLLSVYKKSTNTNQGTDTSSVPWRIVFTNLVSWSWRENPWELR